MTTPHNGGRGAVGLRMFGGLMVAGSLLGLVTSLAMAAHFVGTHERLRVLSAALGGILFAWGVWTGVSLWQRRGRGLAAAAVLCALQVPVFAAGHMVYEFSTAFSVRVMVGNTTRHFGGDIGSSSNIYWSSQVLDGLLGINLVAVFALLYVMRASRLAVAVPEASALASSNARAAQRGVGQGWSQARLKKPTAIP